MTKTQAQNHHPAPLSLPLTTESAHEFGAHWAAAWNRRDIEAVLAHFADDCTFESPLAEKYAGTTRLRGKESLRTYWQSALAGIGELEFTLDFVAIAPERRALTIVYQARLGSRHVHACERLLLDEQGLVRAGMGLYGPPVLAA